MSTVAIIFYKQNKKQIYLKNKKKKSLIKKY